MLVLIKLGGSLITDKRVERSLRKTVVIQLADEIHSALSVRPDLKIVIGHGSGSFGHFAASQNNTIAGVHTEDQWRAFAHVATVAAELNYLVGELLVDAGLPVWRIQPSASALSKDGELDRLNIAPIQAALDHNLIPVVYGDVSLDELRGGTIISTEKIFHYVAYHLPVDQILLLGEVEGVYDVQGIVIPEITPSNYPAIQASLGGSAGVDVTGGMETKVSDMLSLVRAKPNLGIRIMDGKSEGLLESTLLGTTNPGTLIHI
ncbi:MAG: isopentenyl phosphate kinase [Chloroflexota bacterium]